MGLGVRVNLCDVSTSAPKRKSTFSLKTQCSRLSSSTSPPCRHLITESHRLSPSPISFCYLHLNPLPPRSFPFSVSIFEAPIRTTAPLLIITSIPLKFTRRCLNGMPLSLDSVFDMLLRVFRSCFDNLCQQNSGKNLYTTVCSSLSTYDPCLL